ncbi:flagellar hook-basal body complex protein [Neptunomonas qingdaonensis]|uniref:Flagellar hook protein FlgE n=1 Tax=Neptunomonas qingdaonensis TaxID=1045558 RepID=A0A1I2N456_9GAMM|nr:flagellar hook-basal body complex protein [Neptunomonas qingdaonensis]SFF97629.1 flagellar hook-basal body protein [Neptunomonas qingdaonensis]
MAGFNIAVTGLKASSTMLDVAGNNIANSSTVGYKSSRTEFGDIYTASVVGAGSSNTPGSGVTVANIAQDFSSGTLEFTNNNLDLAINGSGFFQLDDQQGGITYTRAGAFELDKEGNVVSSDGKRLQGYGLDEKENRLPIGDLAVNQKEYPPKATSDMDLSFNIDARNDATTLLPNYDKDAAGSYTYSTTVRTYDSLGNEHTIKYNFVEQRPEQEYSQYDAAAGIDINVSGVALTLPDQAAGTLGDFEIATDAAENGAVTIYRLSDAKLEELQAEENDPRIFDIEYRVDGADITTGKLKVLTASEAIEYGDVLVTDTAGDIIPSSATDSEGFVSSNQKQYYEFISGSYAASQEHEVKIAGVDIKISTGAVGLDSESMALAIRDRESDIIEANPLVQSVSWDPDQGEFGSIRVEFKPEASESELSNNSLTFAEVSGNALFSATPDTDISANYTIAGDNSFDGVYRMYAYLNGEEALDIGKLNDPGFGSSTEPGPVIIKYDPTNGILSEINGEEIRTGAAVPDLIISGADPADPTNTVTLSLAGSTQFASDSIIKASDQDGYPKGDLIGVSFAGTGEMIAAFSNGEELKIGVVAIASFENQAGLQSSGDTEWTATLASGSALLNPPGTGLNGLLNSASLEQSNVDLSAELVKLIEAQRNFQANSKTLETLNTVTQSILQI